MTHGQRLMFNKFKVVANDFFPEWECHNCHKSFLLGTHASSLGGAAGSIRVSFKCPHCKETGETIYRDPLIIIRKLLVAWDSVNQASELLPRPEKMLEDIEKTILSIQSEFDHIDFLPENWREIINFYGEEAYEKPIGYMLVDPNLKIPTE